MSEPFDASYQGTEQTVGMEPVKVVASQFRSTAPRYTTIFMLGGERLADD
jgi:hypothetical protein